MSEDPRFLSVGALITRVFPDGTDNVHERLSFAPDFPPDLFAVAALLVQSAGAYNYMVPQGEPARWPNPCVCLDEDRLQTWANVGVAWSREYPKLPTLVQELWTQLWDRRNDPLFIEPEKDASPPAWWLPAYGLMVIADEACAEVGYLHIPVGDQQAESRYWTGSWVALTVDTLLRSPADDINPSDRHRRINQQIASICIKADRDVVCVQPKSHTPEVGCTPRTLAHNLALLPPRGEMRAHWQRPPQLMLPEARTELRLLLIPFPYGLRAGWFIGEELLRTGDAALPKRGAPPWGWFEIRQRWLTSDPTDVVRFVDALIEQARTVEGMVNGVLFPEYALDWDTYKAVADHLRDKHPEVEFFVAGTSSNCASEKGNFALSTHFFDEERAGKTVRMAATTSRGKHHRWRLDRHQIEAYDLGESLHPDLLWWEKIPLHQREIHVKVIRSASVFTTMICEDLARSDPCHQVLRAIGPNLVFVLLMDGPQLPVRWSARYATGLSDDPGSSVLTFTSRGLLARSNRVIESMTEEQRGTRKPDWTIALWKDSENSAYPIECPPGQQAVVLKLRGRKSYEATLDGRQNDSGFTWRRSGNVVQISLDPERHGELLVKLMP